MLLLSNMAIPADLETCLFYGFTVVVLPGQGMHAGIRERSLFYVRGRSLSHIRAKHFQA